MRNNLTIEFPFHQSLGGVKRVVHIKIGYECGDALHCDMRKKCNYEQSGISSIIC